MSNVIINPYNFVSAIPFENTYSLDFDGVDGFVDCGTGSNLVIPNTLTVSVWVKTTSTANEGIVVKGTNNGDWAIISDGGSTSYAKVFLNNVARIGGTLYPINDGNWHHIAFTYDSGLGSNNVVLYVDGSPDGTANFTTALNNTAGVKIGYYYSLSYSLDGNIDEVSIWNTTLSSGDITTLYNSGTPTNLNTSLGTTPVAWYRMGDSGTFFNSNWELPNQLKINNFSSHSMTFDGVSSYVDCGQITGLAGTTAFTISGWFNQTIINQQKFLFGTYISSTNLITMYTWSDGNMYFEVRNGANTYASFDYSTLVTAGEWFHCVCVFDGSGATDADKFKIYIDGSSATLAFVGTLPTSTNATQGDFWIGKNENWSQEWSGNIDGVSIWNEALTSGNVTSIYADGVPNDVTGLGISGLVAYWRMGEGITNWNGTNWQLPDYSKNTLFSQKSLEFDGVSSYIDCGNDNSLQPTGAITLSAWAKLDIGAYNDQDSLITQDHPAYAGLFNGYQLRWGQHPSLVKPYLNFALCDDSTSTAYVISGIFSPSTPLNTWHHICGIWNGTTMELFFDGVSMGTLAFSGTITYNTAINTLIGGERIGFYHSGNIDEVSIFNSAKAIGDLWDGSGAPTDLSAESGLVAYYRMGENATWDGSDWTIPDASTNSNDGTSSGMAEIDLKFNAPGNLNAGLSDGMDIDDKVNNAPDNINQGLSSGMDEADREEETP